MDFRQLFNRLEDISSDHEPQIGDIVEIELGDTLVETFIEDITDDGVIIKVDETALRLMIDAKKALLESKPGLWANIHAKRERIKQGSGERMRKPGSKGAPSAQDFKDAAKESMYEEWDDEEGYETDDPKHPDYAERQAELADYERDRARDASIDEAEYQGRKVQLGKPMAGDVKKSKVYVKGPKGNVVKVNFGDKNMRIKKSNPGRRKNFRARHNCDNPGPRWKARYWSCRAW